MIKNILIFLIILGLGAAGYVYYSSKIKPEGVSIASDIATGMIITGAATQPTTTADIVTGSTVATNTTYKLVANSLMGRKGSKIGGFHTGTIAISSGVLSIAGDKIVGGSFSIDMTSVKLLDIQDPTFEGEIKEGLFEASKYPVAIFDISGTSTSGETAVIEGSLTIKGISHPIKIPTTSLSISDTQATAVANFAIERSKRGLTKREGIVNEYLEFTLNITATK